MSLLITNLNSPKDSVREIDNVTMHILLINFSSISFMDFLLSNVYTYTDEKSGIQRKFKKVNQSKKVSRRIALQRTLTRYIRFTVAHLRIKSPR